MSKALINSNYHTAMPTPAGGNLGGYLQTIAEIPVFSLEEEQELARKLRHDNDLEAARRLVLSQLRFVVHIARGYNGYGLPLADLVQEGNVGLMKAVKRFDPDVGVRLISFAVHWIRAEIHEYVIRNWRIVKVATTKAQRKLFFKLRSSKTRLGWLNHAEVQAVAKDLGVKPETVLEMESRLSHQDTPFDLGNDQSDDSHSISPSSYLQQENADPALLLEHQDHLQQQQAQLSDSLKNLDERSQDILQQRWLSEKKATLHELAAKYGVSAERIRQLEKSAMKKLRGSIEA
ncbi:MAG: RNA polymerase sigma factor RpoH [Gammaproteobacteria bacterium]|nr:RNA polymerase sigma factor RpoH [Gammaproteobacteria bacterium]